MGLGTMGKWLLSLESAGLANKLIRPQGAGRYPNSLVGGKLLNIGGTR